MCGLVALYSLKDNGFTGDEGKMFEHSMVFNQLRGDDSTGTVSIDNKDAWSFLKTLGGWRALTRHNKFPTWRAHVMNHGKLAFGHGRAATKGSINIDNAHPFRIQKGEEEIIFMHNGTLPHNQRLPGMGLYDVDSEYLGAMIAVHGAEKALSEVQGAMAVMWWDVKRNTFNFFRNHERPLYYMSLKDGAFIINSEGWILEYLNWKFKLGAEPKDIYMVRDLDIYSVSVNGESAGKYQITSITKVYGPPVTPTWGGNLARFMYEDGDYNDESFYDVTPPFKDVGLPPEDKEFWDRSISMIEWMDGKKIVRYKDKHITTHMNETPPEPDLLRMYESNQTGNIIKAYNVPGKASPLYVEVKYREWKEAKEAAKKVAPEPEPITPALLHSVNQNTIKFTTRLPGPDNRKVKHKGKILQGKAPPHLQQYENSLDGSVELGEVKTVELIYAEVLNTESNGKGGEGLIKVVCAEMKDKQDTYIDYVFHTTEYTKKQVEEMIYFKGMVGSITINKQQADITGAYCVCRLQHVKPVLTLEIDEETGIAEVKSFESKEDDQTKTVH